MDESKPHILMCPPEFYGIEYEINPWMSRSRQADRPLAHEQWRRLYETLGFSEVYRYHYRRGPET